LLVYLVARWILYDFVDLQHCA